MKKIILILLVAVMGLTMFACGKGTTNTGSLPTSDNSPSDTSPYDEQDAHGGSGNRALDFKYVDKCVGLNRDFVDYIESLVGMDIDTWQKTVLKTTDDVTNGGIFNEISSLGISKEDFIRINSSAIDKISEVDGFPSKEIYDNNYCFTDEEIEIIYSGDKKRIAEAFANPYAVIAGDWEIYPLRWIIENPASLYKEKQISFKALETAVNKLLETKWIYDEDDRAALKARVEEYRKLQ